ncbi:MAG: hypothetical protein LC789_07395 [Actinobacteria bacterium]|nr:hypothetical protein [Actinomycetota bacterium]MCA1721692.1 hypothetical protein [Actinomycetota bacterium]
MTPIDDELRSMLVSRADVLAPAADPLAGIERRANRMRRNRLAASVAGTALAVSAIAVAVPTLLPDSGRRAPQVAASTEPSAEPTVVPATRVPATDWPARGNATPEALAFARTSYAKAVGRTAADVTVRLLWGGSPDGGPQVLLAVATGAGPAELVVVYYAEDGEKRLVSHDLLDVDAREVNRVVVPGSEPYVVAVGEPGATEIAYALDGGDDFEVKPAVDGVATFRRLGPTRSDPDLLLYTFGNGEQITVPVHTGPAEGQARTSSAYVLDPAHPWAYRGDPQAVQNGNLATFKRDWAVRRNVPESSVTFTALYGEHYEPANSTVIAYLARSGDGPWFWGVGESTDGGTHFHLDKELPANAMALPGVLRGDEVGRLLVLTAPGTAQALYYPDGTRSRAMASIADGVWITPLDGDQAADRLVVLDGDGNIDKPLYDQPAPGYENAG